jgi:hypothetical protein
VKLTNYLGRIPHDGPVAIFVGAMARGSDDFADGIVDEKISISNYPLSASVACGKVSLHLSALRAHEVYRTPVLLRAGRPVGHRVAWVIDIANCLICSLLTDSTPVLFV